MGIIENTKALAELAHDIKNIELHRAILDLRGEVMDLVQENRDLKTKIKELEETLNFKGELKHFNNAYWFEEAGRQVPICTGCWDANSQQIRLKDFENGFAECPICKNTFEIAPGKGY